MNSQSHQDEAEFKKLQQNGLLPSVKDFTDYNDKVNTGIAVIQYYLKENPILEMPKDSLSGIHQVMFQEVYESAGRLRTKPQETAWIAGRPGVDPQRNHKELDLLNAQFNSLMQKADSPESKVAAIAFYHSRLILIQPFTDGNKRLSREVMDSQLNAVFGTKKRQSLDNPFYRDAVTSLLRETDMTRMLECLLHREGLSVEKAQSLVPEYRIAPFFYQEEMKNLTLPEDLARSIKTIVKPEPPTEPKRFKFF